jgi:uncharacterized protein involved in exopolysaccharide biosynthesis
LRNGGTPPNHERDLDEIRSPTQRANRRKLLVFLGVFLLASAASLAYTFGRPAEYRASSRVQINPGAVQVEAIRSTGGSQGADAPRPFMTELQVLTSRPVVEAAAKRLSAEAGHKLAPLGPDHVTALQSSLVVSPAGGTDVVELAATGGDPELVAALVNTVTGTYKDRLEQAYRDTSSESLAQINDEVAKLEARLSEKRRFVEDFRIRHNVVSLEREENQVLSRVRGQSTAFNTASERLAAAEGKLRSLNESAAEGRSVVRARDNPTLANLEQRASVIREDLREQERNYTPGYLAFDNKVVAQRARLAELERQIASQRKVSEETSLAEAKEEAASAREVVSRIQQQMAADRGAVQAFTARFNEYKGLREELTQLEGMYRDSMQRRVKLEAGERARRPSVKILEAATVPQEPWRPLYLRDAVISIVGSLLLALLIMWLVELFNRSDPQPTLLVAQPMPYTLMGGLAGDRHGGRSALVGSASPAIEAAPTALLTAGADVPRELTDAEITSLLQAGTPDVKVAVALLLSGLSPDELIALQWDDVDQAARQISVGGDSPRTVEILEPTMALLERVPLKPGARFLAANGETPRTVERLTTDLLYAAHDAGIERPATVTPAALRHTYIAFLARQSLRLGDLVKLVGRLLPEQAAAYSDYAAPGKRLTLAEVERVMAGVREAEFG